MCIGTSRKLLIETKLQGSFKFYLRFGENGKEQFLHVVTEYLRKITSDYDELSCPSTVFPQIPESLHSSTFDMRNFKQSELGSQGFSSSFAGVAGILRRQECDRTGVDALQKQAFTDLQALMNSAEEVLSVLEKYSSTIEKGIGRYKFVNYFLHFELSICFFLRSCISLLAVNVFLVFSSLYHMH